MIGGIGLTSGGVRATTSSCGTNCVLQTSPYSLGYYSNTPSSSGSGDNSYSYGPVIDTNNGAMLVDQNSVASDSGAYSLWTYIELQGQAFDLPSEEYAQFQFVLSSSWSWDWNVACLAGSVQGEVGAAFLVGVVGYPQYSHEYQLFADNSGLSPCILLPHEGVHVVEPDQGGSGGGETFIDFGEFLSAGYYTPFAELAVYTYAYTLGASGITSTVDMGSPGSSDWAQEQVYWSYPAGGCFIFPATATSGTTCFPNMGYAPGETMEMSTTVPASTSPVSVQAYINGVGESVHSWDTATTGWTYTIDFGAAPNSPGDYQVYSVVTFANGSTATTNTCLVVIT